MKKFLHLGITPLILAMITACSSDEAIEKSNEEKPKYEVTSTEKETTEEETENTVQTQNTDEAETTDDENESQNTSNTNEAMKQQYSNHSTNTTDSNSNSTTANTQSTNGSEQPNSSTDHNEEEAIHITSSSEAIDYLKTKLEMENNKDILFDDLGGNLQTDEYGSYYMIILISKSFRESGGSGTLGRYRVYEDGKYELDY